MYLEPIKKLEVELTTSCNAKCHFCFRQDARGLIQQGFQPNRQLDAAVLQKVFADFALARIEEVIFCGNYGDPLAHSKLIEILDLLEKMSPGIAYSFHTNGSLGSEKTWRELGKRAAGKGRFVTFSIDGLEDTNHLYRRGLSWDAIMRNVNTFLTSGGRAVWKFVVFPHNEHQVEAAKEMAKRLGFARFRTAANYASDFLFQENGPSEPEEGDDIKGLEISLDKLPGASIECIARRDSFLYLDHSGRVWPCCWIGGWKYASGPRGRWHRERLEAVWPPGFNSIGERSLSEILEHPWFRSHLPESWAGQGGRVLHPECFKKCGKAATCPTN